MAGTYTVLSYQAVSAYELKAAFAKYSLLSQELCRAEVPAPFWAALRSHTSGPTVVRCLDAADPLSLEPFAVPDCDGRGSQECRKFSLTLPPGHSVDRQGLLCQRPLSPVLFTYVVFLGPLDERPESAQACVYG